MLKKIAFIALCTMALATPVFAATNPHVDGAFDRATMQTYVPLWSNPVSTLYADPEFIRYSKISNEEHKNCDICVASIVLSLRGSNTAVGNLAVYDLNCNTKKVLYERKVDLANAKKISEQNFSNPPAIKAAPNNTIEKEILKLKEIQQLQSFNNEMRFGN